MRKIVPILFLFLMAISSLAHGDEQPLDVLKGGVEEALTILRDTQYEGISQKEEQKEKIWQVIRKIFDLKEMAKRTLARNWKRFTPQQRTEFSEVFGEFLGNNYLRKIQGGYKGEKVIYLNQDIISNSKAQVKTKILRETIEIPVNYRMLKRNETWKVYDVVIEGVSLMKNYRRQVNKLLFKESPDQVNERLKKRIEQQKEEGTS